MNWELGSPNTISMNSSQSVRTARRKNSCKTTLIVLPRMAVVTGELALFEHCPHVAPKLGPLGMADACSECELTAH